MRRFVLPAFAFATLGASIAIAQSRASEAEALAIAKRQAAEASGRSEAFERSAAAATDQATRARAAASALVARIEAAEAGITAAETRIRIVETMRVAQRARLAERQGPVVRLTAALQTMARRPPALALVQPGSVNEVVHVRSLLASTLPVIRERTRDLREEIRAGDLLRQQAETARAALVASQGELRRQRIALARLEASQRARSAELASSAINESDRALALTEEARELSALMGTRQYQARVRSSLAELPEPLSRPGTELRDGRPSRPPVYVLPIEGRLVAGMGEISDAGVHARGLTLEARAGAEVAAPRAGRVIFAGPFRDYGTVLIIDHSGGWTTTLIGLASASVTNGQAVRAGERVGRAGRGGRVGVELRRNGLPFPIATVVQQG